MLPNSAEITVFRGWLNRGQYVWSPFVTKLEARLRFGGIKYTIEAGSPRTALKGKIPYVEYRQHSGAPALYMGDSALIARAFTEEGLLGDLGAALSPEKKALDMSVRALLEDKLVFYHVRVRCYSNLCCLQSILLLYT